MNYFKIRSFFYGLRPDGKYIQVATFNGFSLPNISVVSEETAMSGFSQDDVITQITAKEFKHTFAQAILDITMMDIVEVPDFKTDELNETDVQKEN